jgi:SAM-dependent methyltransferase
MNSYGKLSTTFYDLDKPHPPPDALAFYTQHAHAAGGLILEPMCGSGRFLIPMLQEGFDITGVDASPAMLAACRQRAGHLGLTPRLYQQVLHQMELPDHYRFVMIPAGSFCLLTNPTQVRQSLQRIFHAMAPGATFALEIEQWRPPQEETDPGEVRFVELQEGVRILLQSFGELNITERLYQGRNRYDLVQADQILETEWEDFNLRYYLPETFSSLLTEAGFTNIFHHSAYDPALPDDQSNSLVFICTRP